MPQTGWDSSGGFQRLKNMTRKAVTCRKVHGEQCPAIRGTGDRFRWWQVKMSGERPACPVEVWDSVVWATRNLQSSVRWTGRTPVCYGDFATWPCEWARGSLQGDDAR